MSKTSDAPPKDDRRILVYIGTTTPEKIRDYQLICEKKGLPIYFRDVKELLAAFHSSDEKTQRFTGNAKDKLEKVHAAVQKLMLTQPDAIENECKKYGLTYNPSNVYIATDDGGMHVEKAIWEMVKKKGVSKRTLQSIDENTDIDGGGPGVETGPVMSAMGGGEELSRRLIKGARKAGVDPKNVDVHKEVYLLLKAVNAAEHVPPITADGYSEVKLHEPAPEELPDKRRERTSTYHFYSTQSGGQSIAQDYEGYMVNESEQAKAIEALAKKLKIRKIAGGAPPLKIPALEGDFVVGVMPGADNVLATANVARYLKEHSTQAEGFAVHIPAAPLDTQAPASAQEPLTTRKVLGAIEDTIKESDGFLLAADRMASPTVPPVPETQFDKFYTLFSLMVAKQLVARDMQKPIVIMNHDGSWDEAIANHVQLVNSGLTKDFNVNIPLDIKHLPEGIHIESNSYFDVVGPKKGHAQPVTDDQAMSAALEVLKKRREQYQRRTSSPDREYDSSQVEGVTSIKPEDSHTFKVAVFCSASCENTKLNNNMRMLGKELVQNEFGVVYGAGDRYTMGAVLDGVHDYREQLIKQYVKSQHKTRSEAEDMAKEKAWIAGFSTAPILISETQRGQFSHRLSYYRQTKDIYDRMADMLDTANAVVVAPGGAGTLQEWVAPLMIKRTNPELFKDKAIVIYNPPLFHRVGDKDQADTKEHVWNVAIKSLLGKDYELLTGADRMHQAEREARCKELGIYIETEQEAVQKRLVSIRDSSGWTKADDGKWAKHITGARESTGRGESQTPALH